MPQKHSQMAASFEMSKYWLRNGFHPLHRDDRWEEFGLGKKTPQHFFSGDSNLKLSKIICASRFETETENAKSEIRSDFRLIGFFSFKLEADHRNRVFIAHDDKCLISARGGRCHLRFFLASNLLWREGTMTCSKTKIKGSDPTTFCCYSKRD